MGKQTENTPSDAQEAPQATVSAEAEVQARELIAAAEKEAEMIVAVAREGAASGEDRLARVLEAMQAQTAALVAATGPSSNGGGESRAWAGMDAARAMEELQGSVSEGEAPAGDDLLERPVTFRSRGVNFNVVRKSRHRITHGNGDVEISSGVHYNFAPSGTFTTQDRRVVAYLKARPSFNVEFWLVGEEPHAAPSADAVVDRIASAIAELDTDALEAIEAEERATHKRDSVLMMVAAGRRKLAEQVA